MTEVYTKTYPSKFAMYKAFSTLIPWNVWGSELSLSIKERKEPWCKKAWSQIFKRRLEAQLISCRGVSHLLPLVKCKGNPRYLEFTVRYPPLLDVWGKYRERILNSNEIGNTLEGHWCFMQDLVFEGDTLEVYHPTEGSSSCYIAEYDGELIRKYEKRRNRDDTRY